MFLIHPVLNIFQASLVYEEVKKLLLKDSKEIESGAIAKKFLLEKYTKIRDRVLKIENESAPEAPLLQRLFRHKSKIEFSAEIKNLSRTLDYFLHDRFVMIIHSHRYFAETLDNELTHKKRFDPSTNVEYREFLKIFRKIIEEEDKKSKYYK